MKRIFFLLFVASSAIFLMSSYTYNPTAFQQPKDWNDCLKRYDSEWGAYCENCNNNYENSYRVSLRNVCSEKVDIKCAVQESTKKWKTYSWTGMAANDTMTAYACSGTGKYLYWVRKSGDRSIKFPTDKEINTRWNE